MAIKFLVLWALSVLSISSHTKELSLNSLCNHILNPAPLYLSLNGHTIKGQPLAFSPFRFSPLLQTTTLIPEDQTGHIIVAKFIKDYRPLLYSAINNFPNFFSKYGMFINEDTVILPNASRLNHFNPNGVQIEDIPFWGKQFFSEGYFKKKLKERKIPFSVRGLAFFHDRLEEHLVGTLIMPMWLFEKFVHYLYFETEWLALKSAKKMGNYANRSFSDLITQYRGVAYLWDIATNQLGHFIAYYDRDHKTLEKNVIELANILYSIDQSLIPGSSMELDTQLDRHHSVKFKQMQIDLVPLVEKHKQSSMSWEQAVSEARAIISQLYLTDP